MAIKSRSAESIVYRIAVIKEAGKPDVIIKKPHPRLVAPISEVIPDE